MRSEFDFEDEETFKPPTTGLEDYDLTEAENFGNLDLGKELSEQLARAKRILREVENSEDEKGSSKAALLNSVSQIISRMVSMRVAVWNAERLKELERTLIECLKETDPHLADQFLALYEQRLEYLKASRAS